VNTMSDEHRAEMEKMMNENSGAGNPFNKTQQMQQQQSEQTLPQGVLERIEKTAERTGESKQEVANFYLDYIKKEFGCEDWASEDEDLLIDWAESAFVATRKGPTTGAGNEVYVGQFVGVDARSDNRGTGLMNWISKLYRNDPNEAMARGAGHYVASNGLWSVETANGKIETSQSADETPACGIHLGGNDYICFVSKAGSPYSVDEMGRYAWFLGNEKDAFVNEGRIELWRVDLKGEDTMRRIRVGEPCVISARPPRENDEYRKDVLDTREGFVDTISYRDDFVEEDVRKLLKPSTYWTSSEFHDMFVNLSELSEAYESGAREWSSKDGRSGRSGPLVFVKGNVVRMSTDARDTEYDEGGRSYSLSISSTGLQSMYGSGAGSEVLCNIGSAMHDMTTPFHFTDTDGEKYNYAEGSTIFVFGRVGMMRRENTEVPKLTAFGIYCDSRRARRGASGGNADPSQFE